MLNIILVSDSNDVCIGENCVLSHQHLQSAVDVSEQNCILLNGDLCTRDAVENTIASFNEQKFILVAYSHGSQDALISTVATDGYVNLSNSYRFATSLIYTNCCYSAVNLKQRLIDAGCFGYVGYSDQVFLPYDDSDFLAFISCENHGLIHFLATSDSLTDSVNAMKTKYVEQYDKFLVESMNLAAVLLLHNLNCLTYYDHSSLTRVDLEN